MSSKNDDSIIMLKPNDEMYHPISLHKIVNSTKSNVCLTKFKINKKGDMQDYQYNYKCTYNLDNYNKFMYIPPAGISYSDILKLYNIDSNNIDDLIKWINDNQEGHSNLNQYTINRVINCWIKQNYDLLKSHNKTLIKLNKYLYNEDVLNNIDFEKFINKWIKNNKDIFYLNYVDDLNNYIKNYDSKKKYKK